MGDKQSRLAAPAAEGTNGSAGDGVDDADIGNAEGGDGGGSAGGVSGAIGGGGAAAADGALSQDIPSEADILSKLVSALGACPSRSMAISEILASPMMPTSLRRLASDPTFVRGWLMRFGLFEVSGAPGEEIVTLVVGKAPQPSPPPTSATPSTLGDAEKTNPVAPTASTPTGPVAHGAASAEPQKQTVNGTTSEVVDGQNGTLVDDDAVNPCTVQLRGLPFRATVPDIKAFLGVHADSLSATDPPIRLLHNRDGRPSGFARVQFNSPEAAKEAREQLHRQAMGDRYVEVLTCTERTGKTRNRRTSEGDANTGAVATPGAASTSVLDSAAEAPERERVLQECREHMRMPGRGQILLSMLGIALSPPARTYLRRANLGLKHFLARFPNEFRVEGPKGCERVIWNGGVGGRMPAVDHFMNHDANYAAATAAAAVAAGAAPHEAAAYGAAMAAHMTRQAHAAWGASSEHYNQGATQDAQAMMNLEAAAMAAAASQASQAAQTASKAEPSTPKRLASPAMKNLTATPSDWGTPGPANHSLASTLNGATAPAEAATMVTKAADGGAAAQGGGAMDMGGYPGAAWAQWPPMWGATPGMWPPPWSGMQQDGSLVPPPFPGTDNGSAGQNGTAGGKTNKGNVPTTNNNNSNSNSGAASRSEVASGAGRSHAHLHPHSHPFAHLQRSGTGGEGGEKGANCAVNGAGGGGEGDGEAPNKSPCIRLRGLPFSMTVQDVLAFFSLYEVAGCIADGTQAAQLLPKANGRPSGQAVVQMRSRADAEQAKKALSNQWIGGRWIEVFVYGEDGEVVDCGSTAPASDNQGTMPAAPPAAHAAAPTAPAPDAATMPAGCPMDAAAAAWGRPPAFDLANPWGMPPAVAPWGMPPVPGAGAIAVDCTIQPGGHAAPDPNDPNNQDAWSALFNFLGSAPPGQLDLGANMQAPFGHAGIPPMGAIGLPATPQVDGPARPTLQV